MVKIVTKAIYDVLFATTVVLAVSFAVFATLLRTVQVASAAAVVCSVSGILAAFCPLFAQLQVVLFFAAILAVISVSCTAFRSPSHNRYRLIPQPKKPDSKLPAS